MRMGAPAILKPVSDTAFDILDERRTTPVELLWDLVFVFAVTQVTTLLSHDLTWAGFGRAMLVLALVWWAWSAYVWAANAQTAASPTLRACLLVSMVSIFITGLSVPHAFGSEGALVAGVALGLLITVGMWWTYFEGLAEAAAERLRGHKDPVLAAADAYSYLHLVIVAGIITFAVGVKVLARVSVAAALPGPARLALCGGVALYLAGTAAFSLRLLGAVQYGQLA